MNLQLLSDLHLESEPDFVPRPAPHAQLLVLAGDIGSCQIGRKTTTVDTPDFGLSRFSPHHGWPTPVLFVPGNHEYDGLDFDVAHARLRETCDRLGLLWLERETRILDGVRFIGTTLWSDFDALAPQLDSTTTRYGPLQQQLLARDKAFRAANFYLRKTGTTQSGNPFLADAVREQALACQHWLRTALALPFDGPTVVVTHFAPSLRSADPRYGLTPGTAGFCNALDDLLPHARLWVHGHLHCPADYVAGGCRVVANPRGYAHKNEQGAFDPVKTLQLDLSLSSLPSGVRP